ncbi:MAG: histidine phosphatase family protein [Alphaproteobacteria bacterium]
MGFLPGTISRRRIYLMRHGHVDYFNPPIIDGEPDTTQVNLTERGQGEARAAGEALKAIRFDKAVCSGYPRTYQTAEGVLAAQGDHAPALEIDADFRELKSGDFNFGHLLTQHSLSEALVGAFDEAWSAGVDGSLGEGGERFLDGLTRALAGLDRLIANSDWATALVVAHEGINRLLLSHIASGSVNAAGAFEQDLACINIIDLDMAEDGSVRRIALKAVNVTGLNPVKDGMVLNSIEDIFGKH